MDPNANLQEQERILAARQQVIEADRLAELREALADWIYNGGFEPDWDTAPLAAPWFNVLRKYRAALKQ